MDFTKGILTLLILVGIIAIALNVIVLNSIPSEISVAKMQVLEKITDNSTNREIVGTIRDVCSNVSWYMDRTYCESTLFDTFIGDINEH